MHCIPRIPGIRLIRVNRTEGDKIWCFLLPPVTKVDPFMVDRVVYINIIFAPTQQEGKMGKSAPSPFVFRPNFVHAISFRPTLLVETWRCFRVGLTLSNFRLRTPRIHCSLHQ
jgi:hypothetical protein